MPKKEDYCLNLENCWHPASHSKWNTYYFSPVVLSTIGSSSHKNAPFWWVHSKEKPQQVCAVSNGRRKAKWRKSKLKCRRRNNEASSLQLLRLPDHRPEPTHCNEVPYWQKTHTAINSKLFKKLDHVNNSLHEFELAKAHIEQNEPIIVGFFILQYGKLRMLELYCIFFPKFCDVKKFQESELDTDSLYLALAGKELEDCIRPKMRWEWQRLQSNDCVDCFTANVLANFFRRNCCVKHKQHDKRKLGLFKEEFRCTEMFCLCSKT